MVLVPRPRTPMIGPLGQHQWSCPLQIANVPAGYARATNLFLEVTWPELQGWGDVKVVCMVVQARTSGLFSEIPR